MARRKMFYLNTDLLDCFECHDLDPEEYKRQFMAAVLKGEKNAISKHIKFTLGRPYVPGWHGTRAAVLARDNHTCRYCGRAEGPIHCDHVIPLSRGGSSDPDNLVAACRSCNSRKKDKTPEEWLSAGG